MRIQFISDLHLEYSSNYSYLRQNPIQVKAETLVIAGDLLPLTEMKRFGEVIDFFSGNYQQVFWVPGNHEYYGSNISIFARSLDIPIRKNIRIVDNTVVIQDGVALIFSTLWSKIPALSAGFISSHMPDFRHIRNRDKPFDVAAYNHLHQRAKSFLINALSKYTGLKKIVVTHHLPTFTQYPKQYRTSKLNNAFATELSPLIEKIGPDYWVFGHHHQPTDRFKIGSTILINNQMGYVDNYEHTFFKSFALGEESDDDVIVI